MPLDPTIETLLAAACARDPRGIDKLSVEEARERGGSTSIDALVPFEDVRHVTSNNPVSDGVTARAYRPADGTLPHLVYFHGGGWVVGSVDISDNFCRALANRS